MRDYQLVMEKRREALKEAEEEFEGVTSMRDTIKESLALGMAEEEVLRDLLREEAKST